MKKKKKKCANFFFSFALSFSSRSILLTTSFLTTYFLLFNDESQVFHDENFPLDNFFFNRTLSFTRFDRITAENTQQLVIRQSVFIGQQEFFFPRFTNVVPIIIFFCSVRRRMENRWFLLCKLYNDYRFEICLNFQFHHKISDTVCSQLFFAITVHSFVHKFIYWRKTPLSVCCVLRNVVEGFNLYQCCSIENNQRNARIGTRNEREHE